MYGIIIKILLVKIIFCISLINGECEPCIASDCYNGATCVVNTTDCSKFCICPSSYTGRKCENDISSDTSNWTTVVPSTTLRPFSERTCLFGMVLCEHGYCTSSQKCACDANWTGFKCNKLNCPLTCENICELLDNEVVCINKKLETTSSTSEVTTIPPATSPNQDMVTSSALSTLRDEKNRTCFGGLCVHGYCHIGKIVITCVCDEHWKGMYCDSLDCPTHCAGACLITNGNVSCSETISTQFIQSTEVSTTAKTSEVTLRSLADRTCLPGFFVCVHGYCMKNSVMFRCECDLHWTGSFCDKLDCNHCSSGKCTVEDNSTVCLSGVTDSSIIDDIQLNTTTPITSSTTDFALINSTYPDDHVCSDNYVKNISNMDPFCFLPCVHGHCKRLESTNLKCACDLGATGDLCEKTCCKRCGEQGVCKLDINSTEYCNCKYNYEGEFCEIEIVPLVPEVFEEETWYWWVVGTCLGLIVLLIFALVVIPYWMWRNRVILIMKIVHYFQRYEDNDDREWDAFVSYKCDDKDESFVLRQLYSKLEVEMGYRLCLHFRDFIPGDTIANNIIRAVQGSRRTILLLTPRYVQSEFTKFEYQMAQTEMLKKRHRIIPLVLEDIKPLRSEMDPNLEQIINSVTYLEWPTDEDSNKIQRFWKKLALSMPKKKDVEERMKSMESSSSPTSYSSSSPLYEIPLVSRSVSTDSSLNGEITSYDQLESKSNGHFPSEHKSNGHIPLEPKSNGHIPSEQKSNGHISLEPKSNGLIPTEPIKNNDIVLKISDEALVLNSNEVKQSNINQNISAYLDLIDDSMDCSHT